MAQIVKSPSVIKAAGTKNKIINEYFGHVNSGTSEVSIAHMKSPQGWVEPGQSPEFNEYTVVLKGKLMVSTKDKEYIISEGQAIMTGKKEWVKYSTPFEGGAEYIAVCLPAFSPDIVFRDKD
jgi:quercetin dioxygenase-like cupin family protein